MNKMQKPYEAINFPPLTAKQKSVLEKLSNLPDDKLNLTETEVFITFILSKCRKPKYILQ